MSRFNVEFDKFQRGKNLFDKETCGIDISYGCESNDSDLGEH